MPGLMLSNGLITAYGAINGITGYFQNQHVYKNDESKFVSLLSGREGGEYSKISRLLTYINFYSTTANGTL